MLFNEMSTSEIVADLVNKYTARWWESSTEFPSLGPIYTLRDQLAREKELSMYLDQLYNRMRRPQDFDPSLPENQERLLSLTAGVIKTSLGLGDRHIQAILDRGFREAILEFFHMARRYDSHIRDEDIYQAIRNSTSMHLMQILLGLPVQVTPSIFAFSMLYPYTDNYLDDASIPPQEKQTFNQRFRRRLAGEALSPANQHEAAVYGLVGMIESQFARPTHARLFDSLLAIHHAQSKSLKLVGQFVSPYQVDVLGTCLEKGGCSALADGYLIAGDLTPQQCDFVFFYGAFTQLMDDLEDVHNDLEAGIMTVFSVTARRWPLDGITNRVFHFGRYLFEALEGFDAPDLEAIKEMFSIVYYPILIDAAACAKSFYTRPYYKQLQVQYPMRFSYLQKQRNRFQHKRQSLKLLLESLAMYAISNSGV